MRILGRIVGVRSTEQSVGIKVGAFDPGILIKIYFEITIQNRISSPDSAPDRGEKLLEHLKKEQINPSIIEEIKNTGKIC